MKAFSVLALFTWAMAAAMAAGSALTENTIGYTEFRTDLPGGRHPNISTSRACLIRADGSGRHELAADLDDSPDRWTQFAGWSPDGRQAVVLVCSNSAANAAWEEKHRTFRFSEGWLVDILLIDLETKARKNLTEVDRVSTYNSGLFFWPKDPQRLGFTALIDGVSHPFSMDLEGRRKKDLSAGPSGFTYGFEASPDGKHVAYHKDYQVFVADEHGAHPRPIRTENSFNFAPRWSPDGQWLLFLSGRHYDCHPVIVRADGSGLRKLADRAGYRGVVEILDVPDYHGGSSDVPVWSQDSRSVYGTAKDGESIELIRATLEGATERLTRSNPGIIHYHPVPSPDGRWLSFGSTRGDGRRQLFIMPATGGEPQQVTQVPEGWAAMHAHWKPEQIPNPNPQIPNKSEVQNPKSETNSKSERPNPKQIPSALGMLPRDAVPLEAPELPTNYRLHVEFSGPAGGVVQLGKELEVPLTNGAVHDVALEYPAGGAPVLRIWSGAKLVRGPEEVPELGTGGIRDFPGAAVDLGADFTAFARFQTTGNGTLFSKCAAQGVWSPNAKALFIRNGRLVYDIGWLGAMSGGGKVNDGQPHTAVLTVRGGHARLWLDGQLAAEKHNFTRPDVGSHVLKAGHAAPDFGGDFIGGKIEDLRLWRRALDDAQVALLSKSDGAGANTPDFAWVPEGGGARPALKPAPGVTVTAAWVQSLERADHAELVRGWNAGTFEEGKQIYMTLCVVCHGTKEQPGSLPTALRFAEGQFKNGSDPFSMFLTLTKGFGQMVPQSQYTTAQKYSVIHYIREAFLRPHNPGQFFDITPATLAAMPKALARAEAEHKDERAPPYQRMDFGPALFWTIEIGPGNIAHKAIAIRLDDGPGGVSKGRAWMIYDHDTMRVAATTTGAFADWKGIAFDGSHGTHMGLTGDRHFVNPVGPGWAGPDGKWEDARLRGRDSKPYGPLPREWAHYVGLHLHGKKVTLELTVGGTRVLESPGWLDYGSTPVFTRTLNVGASNNPLVLRVAPDTVRVALTGHGSLRQADGFWFAELPSHAMTRLFVSRADPLSLEALARSMTAPLDLAPFTHGGPPRWTQEVTTTIEPGPEDAAFIADRFPLPEDNPWQSWMRPGAFDFTPDGQAAMMATWNGDVWRVDGLTSPASGTVRWRRMATGLFQPLGVKFRAGDLFITCRDQLARLRDLNGDGETDFLENFNNDHQVTEHFHEFAMGLQTDEAGNFYYAKSARHALPAVVPHHGTLLRVSADGSRTDIVANGFRAANGVCLNADGTFFVTDQEGHWTPKNRINHVRPQGFYGNLLGYTGVTETADSAMEPPMVWITNEKDRSPAELVRVPKGLWGPLGGSLLNLSYGTGRVFIVLHEEVDGLYQGAVCELPMPAFPTGIMRGRFGRDGALYVCGMFAWAGNVTEPGGFYRIRPGSQPSYLPLAVHASKGALTLRFSDALDPAGVHPGAFALKVWSLKRAAAYGSQHYDERPLAITTARLDGDRRTVALEIPALAATQCYELTAKLRDPSGNAVSRSLHGTIHRLRER